MNVQQALSSMCYREARPGTWLKPVGAALFIFEEGPERWTCWFREVTGRLGVYDSHVILPDVSPLDQIKGWETYTRILAPNGNMANFELAPEV